MYDRKYIRANNLSELAKDLDTMYAQWKLICYHYNKDKMIVEAIIERHVKYRKDGKRD